MKHFVVDVHYTAPLEIIDKVLAGHREFLQAGYESGMLLMSGSKNPRTGGVIVARAESLDEIEAFFARDPYCVQAVATHTIVEFNPVKRQDFMVDWIEGR